MSGSASFKSENKTDLIQVQSECEMRDQLEGEVNFEGEVSIEDEISVESRQDQLPVEREACVEQGSSPPVGGFEANLSIAGFLS